METIPDIMSKLKTYNQYHYLSDYYIKKEIKNKYNLKTVKKNHLLTELENLKNITLPSDMINVILYQLDFNDIKSYCLSAKNACDNFNWTSLFARDHLPLLEHQTTSIGWINHYNQMRKIKNEVDSIIKILKNLYQFVDYVELIIKDKQIEVENINNELSFSLQSTDMTLDEFELFLTNTIYNDTSIEFEYQGHYVPLRLKHLKQTKKRGIKTIVKKLIAEYNRIT